MDNYFASANEIIRLKKENLELELELKSEYVIISNSKTENVQDKYFGCDVEYITLLLKNQELKQKMIEMVEMN